MVAQPEYQLISKVSHLPMLSVNFDKNKELFAKKYKANKQTKMNERMNE